QDGGGDGRHLLDLDQDFLDRRRFTEDTSTLLEAPALDDAAHGGGDFARIDGLYEPGGEAELAADLAGIVVGGLDQAEGGDGVIARGGEQGLGGRFVQ